MRRRSLLVGIALLAWTAAGCRKSAPDRDRIQGIQVSAEMGLDGSFGGSWSSESWTALSIDLASSSIDLQGELRVRGRGLLLEDRTPLVSRRFTLPAGGQRRFSVPVLPTGWEGADVSFEVEGKTHVFRHELPVFTSRRIEDRRVVVVGENLPRLDALRIELDRHLEAVQLPGSSQPELPRLRVVAVSPAALPESWAAWEPMSLVVLYAPDLSRARPQALQALDDWVRRGGNLVAFPGPGWAQELPEPLGELLGLESISPLGEGPEGVPRDVATGPWYRLEAASDARLARERTSLEHRRGTGKSWTLAWAPRVGEREGADGEALTSPTGFFPLATEASVVYPPIVEAFTRSESFAARAPERLQRLSPVFQRKLSQLTGFSFPSRERVSWAVILYLGFGFLAPYLFFRSRRRPEFAYLVIALASLGACYGIYRYGLLGAISTGRYEEFSVVRLAPEGELSARTSFVSLLTPEFDQLEHAEPGLRSEGLRGFQNERRGGARPRLRYPESERDPVELELPLRPNAPETISIEGWIDARAHLGVEALGDGKYRVLNKSSSPLEVSRLTRGQGARGQKTTISGGQAGIVERSGHRATPTRDDFEQALVGAVTRSATDEAQLAPLNPWDMSSRPGGEGQADFLVLSWPEGVLPLEGFERQSARTIFLLELPHDGN